MSRQQFKYLLQRYLRGTCTSEEGRMLEKWYDMLPDKDKLSLNEEDYQAMEDRLWQKISEATPHSKSFLKISKKTRQWVAIAAGLLLPILLFTFWPSAPNLQIVNNDSADTLRVNLPDGSIIQLLQGGSLSYAAEFSPRKVCLVGSAIFDVTSDPLRPFRVLHGKMTTQVLGTRFSIQDGDAEESEVIVYSGKVQVTQTCHEESLVKRIFAKSEPVELTSNHRVVFNKRRETLQATIVERPKPVIMDKALLAQVRYQAIDLAMLANKLGKIYELDIRVNPNHTRTTFTGDLDNMTLFEQLDLICAVTATRYVIEDRKISIL